MTLEQWTWAALVGASAATLAWVLIVLVHSLRRHPSTSSGLDRFALPFLLTMTVGYGAAGALWFVTDPNAIAAVGVVLWLAAGITGIAIHARRRRRERP